jgi:hypothetical protein
MGITALYRQANTNQAPSGPRGCSHLLRGLVIERAERV